MYKTWCISPQANFSTELSTLPVHGLLSQAELCQQTTSIKPCWQTRSQLTGVVHQICYSVLVPLILLCCIWCIKAKTWHSHLAAGTCLSIMKGIMILKQWVKHRMNDRNTTLTKVAPTFDLCSTTEATNAQCLCCPLTIGPNVGDICVFTTLKKFPHSACCWTWL